MKLQKKLAVGVLTAMLSICFLTACGSANDGTSTGGGDKPNDGKPGTSEGGEENPGSTDNGDKKDDTDDKGDGKVDLSKVDFDTLPDLSTQNGQTITVENSYIMQVQQTNKLLYAQGCTSSIEVTNLKDGTTVREKVAAWNGNSYTEVAVDGRTDILLELDGATYMLIPEKKIALKSIGNADPGKAEYLGFTNLVKGKLTVDGKTYYAEKGNLNLKDKKGLYTQITTYCFDTQGQPVYVFVEMRGNASKTKYLSPIVPTADKSLFKIPNGYKVYTMDYVENVVVIRDENGNEVSDPR